MQLLKIAETCKEKGLEASFVIYGSGAEEKQLKEYVNNKKLCSRRDYITNIDAHNNVVRLELTKNEFDTSECDYYTTYAHVLEVKKGTLEKTVLVNATTKEDPQKGCYK